MIGFFSFSPLPVNERAREVKRTREVVNFLRVSLHCARLSHVRQNERVYEMKRESYFSLDQIALLSVARFASFRAMSSTLRPTDCLVPASPTPGCCIWLNGRAESERATWRSLWNAAELRACTDGGANLILDRVRSSHLLAPSLISGDMDSISDEAKQFFGEKSDCEIVSTPDQDKTDLTKCIELVAERIAKLSATPSHVLILGGLSGRFDHSLATINSLLNSPKIFSGLDRPPPVYLIDGENLTFVVVEGSHSISLDRTLLTGICGVVPFCQRETRVTTSGLKWNLDDSAMEFGGVVSTSNEVVNDQIEIRTSAPLIVTIEMDIMNSCAGVDDDGDLVMKEGNDADLPARFSILAPLKGDLIGKSASDILSMAEGQRNSIFLHDNLSPLSLPSYPRENVKDFKEAAVFTVKSNEHAKSKGFVDFLNDKHMVLIKDLPQAVGMKLSAFYTDTLAKKDPDHRGIEVRDQLNNEHNVNKYGDPIWACDSYFLPKKEAKEYTTGKCAQYQRDLFAMDDFVRENQERCIFCTNFDLTSDRGDLYHEQLQELEKFPTQLRVNDDADLLNQQGHKVHGMNVPQVYLKVPNNKTAAHVENMCMTSVNVNVGMRDGVEGACMWYAVPYEYYGKSEQTPNGLDFLRDTWWPDAEELMDMGVPVYRCVQEVGDTIWIAPGVVHWVVSIGFTNNVAWNVCPMTHVQLTVALHQYQWNKQEKYQSLVPMINLFWRIAKHVKVTDEKVFKLVKKCLIRSLAFSKIVTEWAKEQNLRIIDKPRPHGEGPSFCDVCACEVFNLVFRKKNTEKRRRMIYCAECVREEIRTTDTYDFSVTREYTDDFLKNTFDNFHLHNANTLHHIIPQKRGTVDDCVLSRKKVKKEIKVEFRLATEEIPQTAELNKDFTEEPLTQNNEPLISFAVGETVFAKERTSDTHVFPAVIDRVSEDKGKKRYFVNYSNEWKASGRWVEAFEVDFLVFKEKDLLEDSGVELDTVSVEDIGSEEEDDDEEVEL
ncbi:hypothetical protein PRIPAC_93957 [Pristionchus pacificus]|uniref:Thiamine diphosphokinase n=1 Tax=Pristionchus pacificus TaxID=54126 RepID=A0A2A6CDY1_PRIPA|nr:hypothetical protein PRIPAC_93957 [Pristionchus pacificus]|eukprot:PDM76319.1 hypothetical protein PRIPAC_39923 [Pristionchus pacificus]